MCAVEDIDSNESIIHRNLRSKAESKAKDNPCYRSAESFAAMKKWDLENPKPKFETGTRVILFKEGQSTRADLKNKIEDVLIKIRE
nr:S-layer domain protein [Moritella viscosa]